MSPKSRFIVMFLLMSNTLLLVLLINIILKTQDDVISLQEVLATKTDLINLKQTGAESVLEKECTKCHSINRFVNFHGSEQELIQLIKQMQTASGEIFDPGDVEKIHASLELLKCSQCHIGQGEIKRLGLKSEGEQKEIIRQMLIKSNTNIPDDETEVENIQEAYGEIYGF